MTYLNNTGRSSRSASKATNNALLTNTPILATLENFEMVNIINPETNTIYFDD